MAIPAYDKLGGTLSIVSTVYEGKPAGCLINTLMLAASGKLTISISKENFTCKCIKESKLFTITLLTQDTGNQVLSDFGFKTSAELNKFASLPHVKDSRGIPYLTQDIAVRFSCRVLDYLDIGTHILFVGIVTEVENRSDTPVLTTAYYKQAKEGQIPKASPAHVSGEPGWRCSVCGYILEDETIPDDFRCPICGRGPNMLQKR